MRLWIIIFIFATLLFLLTQAQSQAPDQSQASQVPPGRQCLDKLPDPEHHFYNLFTQYHNCYAYAFQDRNINFTSKPQPGYKAGKPALRLGDYTCGNFQEAIQADYPDMVQDEIGCPCGYSRVFLALDTEGNFQDYHFYRQDENGLWSHKPGSMPIQHRDFSGNRIYNPLSADRHDHENKDINYSIPCGFMCVKRK